MTFFCQGHSKKAGISPLVGEILDAGWSEEMTGELLEEVKFDVLEQSIKWLEDFRKYLSYSSHTQGEVMAKVLEMKQVIENFQNYDDLEDCKGRAFKRS